VSPDGQATTHIFSGVQVAVDGGPASSNLVATQVISIQVPVEGVTGEIDVIYDVRGSCETQGSCKATLTMTAGGVTTPIDFSKSGGTANSFYNRITGKLSGANALIATFCLIVERQALDTKDAGVLTLESLDVSFR